jgi:hypothetical protein
LDSLFHTSLIASHNSHQVPSPALVAAAAATQDTATSNTKTAALTTPTQILARKAVPSHTFPTSVSKSAAFSQADDSVTLYKGTVINLATFPNADTMAATAASSI